jgi:hypothetical protein
VKPCVKLKKYKEQDMDFSCSLLLGGQILGEDQSFIIFILKVILLPPLKIRHIFKLVKVNTANRF